ncbi:hypothetical protein EJF36_16390 [Bacillus sp. HMF5848]|uniref:O-antigen ligase family protein n=1 Tax=Bacillus sp. HMF5848 TaxID=2495421 RepID=UPI000F77E559|nr:O-antigen ligase family protein [Bacillus sp. HMF5848]RSK28313.1 hypothetical protein EJF36_16390 [Bacillus sp. HMF5848]
MMESFTRGQYEKYIILFLFWLTFALSGWVTIEPAPFDILILMVFGLTFFFSMFIFRPHFTLPLLLLWFYILQNIVSMYFMEDEITGFFYFFITFYLIMLWTMLISIISSDHDQIIQSIVYGYVTAGIVSALLGLTAYFNVLPSAEIFLYLGRIKGLFKDPNVFGPFLIPVVLFSLMYFESSIRKRTKIIWLASFLITTSAVFLSFSRAAWINYFISCTLFFVLWIVLSPKKRTFKKRINILVILSIMSLTVLIILINIPPIQSMFETRFGMQHYDSSRFSTQFKVLSTLREYPFGSGPGQSEFISNYSPHSLYVRVLGESGIMGFISFVSFLIITWIRSIYASIQTKSPLYIICTSTLLGLYVNSIVIDTLHWRHFWVLLALPWIYQKKTEKTLG